MKSLLIGAVAGGVAVLLFVLLQPRRRCPECGEVFPRFRRPASGRQAMWGGCTCKKCGCEVDRKGRQITRT